MSIYIDEVLDYLDRHLVCQQADSMESLLEVLRDAYIRHNDPEGEKIRSGFAQLRQVLHPISPESFDSVFSIVCDLCLEHELLAFSQGVLTGMLLMTEVNRLP